MSNTINISTNMFMCTRFFKNDGFNAATKVFHFINEPNIHIYRIFFVKAGTLHCIVLCFYIDLCNK